MKNRSVLNAAALIGFVLFLLAALLFGFSLLWALLAGFVIFTVHGLLCGYEFSTLMKEAWKGVWTVRNILLMFVLIGALTALWRASGTIPYLILKLTGFMTPGTFYLMTFLINAAVSLLTGSSFASAATSGVICMSMAMAAGYSAVLAGGAIISGIYVGDRSSPVSTSALLVADLTGTDLYDNIRNMVRSGLVPFLLTAVLYVLLGLKGGSGGTVLLTAEEFCGQAMKLSWIVIVPALIILVAAAFRVPVKLSMLLSILAAALLSLFLQKMSLSEMLTAVVSGYTPAPDASESLSGGGILSMASVFAIICLSSAFGEIMQRTGLLLGLTGALEKMSRRTGRMFCMVITSLATIMISCNQTLASMLTYYLGQGLYGEDSSRLANDMEDTVVVLSAAVPWCIAFAVPVQTVGADTSCLAASFWVFLLPLWRLAESALRGKREKE